MKAHIETTVGNFDIELYDSKPITVENFVKLAKKGFYDGLIFHRVIPDFMVQGGDPKGNGTGGPGYNIKDEFAAPQVNRRGTISMANAGPNTGGSQFFLNVVDNKYLDKMHPVFGDIVEGMDVVDAICNVPTTHGDKPKTDIIMKKVTIIENDTKE